MTSFSNTSDFIQQLSEGGRIVIQEEIVFEPEDIPSDGVLAIADGTTLVFDGGKLVNNTGSTIMTGNLRPTRVTYHSANVECLLPASPAFPNSSQPYINGEWLDGDVIEWPSGQGGIVRYRLISGSWLRY